MDLPGRHAVVQTARRLDTKDADRVGACCRAITVPTLILWGREDGIVPLEIGERLHEAIGTSELVVLDACGHIPHEEKPAETLKFIEDFLRARDERATAR